MGVSKRIKRRKTKRTTSTGMRKGEVPSTTKESKKRVRKRSKKTMTHPSFVGEVREQDQREHEDQNPAGQDQDKGRVISKEEAM